MKVDEDAVELDAGDVADAEQMGREQVATAANADDRGFLDSRQVIGEIDEVDILESRSIARVPSK